MAAPGFKPHVKLVMEPGNAARLVDDTARKTLVLTLLEGQVLALMNPQSTPETLATSARAAGLDVDVRQVEALLVRAETNGFLEQAVPRKRGETGLLKIDDVAPAFRTDLLMTAGPKVGLARVEDPQSGNTLSLHDFEVHVARLLDGRHKVSDVIAAAAKLGVSVTPQSLQSFIAQMRTYGLMVEWWSEATQPSTSTWPVRDKWTADIRELYQSALRLFRQGRPQHALEYLDMLLEIQPQTPEAHELKGRVKARLAGTAEADVTFETLHGQGDEPLPTLTPSPGMKAVPAPPPAPLAAGPIPEAPGFAPPTRPQMEEVLDPADVVDAAPLEPTNPGRDLPPLGSAPEPAPFVPTLSEVNLGEEPAPTNPVQPKVVAAPKKKKSRRGWLVFLVLIAGLFVPVPAIKGVACEVKPMVLAEAKVAGGTFHTLLAKPGQHVDVGTPLADLDTDKANAQKQQLEKDIARFEAAAQKAEEKAKPKGLTKLRERLAKAEKDLAKAPEEKRAAKQKALEKLQKTYDEANGLERAAELRAQIAAAKARLPGLQKKSTERW